MHEYKSTIFFVVLHLDVLFYIIMQIKKLTVSRYAEMCNVEYSECVTEIIQ